jgi:hypothetical protein
MYPAWPSNTIASLATDKLPVDFLMAEYDSLTKAGLIVLPKKRNDKFPHGDFWFGENKGKIPTREEALSYQSKHNVSGWCVLTGYHSRVVVIDLDPAKMEEDPVTVYERLQSMSPTAFVLRSPSNGLHLYYRVPEDRELPPNRADIVKGVDSRGQGGQVVTLGGINTYTGEKAKDKGVADGHIGTYSRIPFGEYDEVPYMTEAMYVWVTIEKKVKTPTEKRIEAQNYGETEVGRAKLEAHFKQPFLEREKVVAEALLMVLDAWDEKKSYDDWLQMWMAAHHGSDGSLKIRDIILTHPRIYWSDGEEGQQTFIRTWAEHEWRDSGYTIASLFWLARQVGWMSLTGYEIDKRRMKTIDYRYISEWVESLVEIPTRLLLQSQTGSGKTQNIKHLYERLNSPKTVIFVPTKKLATELAMTLREKHKLPVTLYRDVETQDVIAIEEMVNAQVLVTTLQTFASKLNVPMERYGLVYIEESDQLLGQFARGGGGIFSSHVDDNQARKGYAKLREAMEKSGVVWFVDATMSKVTQTVAEQMYDGFVEIIYNKAITQKAPVTILPDKALAYQKVLEGLITGKRVVVAADTAIEAELVAEIMNEIGALEGKRAIVITRHTENRRDVRQFMEDVNYHAGQYDLVCYNSVMASGVSITDIRPDVLVQIGTYLPPRVNLQILNRYRNQNRVYAYYMTHEDLYAPIAEVIEKEAENRALLESMLVNMPIAERMADARLRSLVAAISIADEKRQYRAPREFYISLLEGDGREVKFVESEPMFAPLSYSIEAVREIRKEQAEYLKSSWRNTPPIDEKRPAKPEYTSLEVAQGEIHAWIDNALRGNIPELDAAYIYGVVKDFAKYGFILTAFLKQELAVKKAEAYLADSGRSLMNLLNNVTLIKLLALIRLLFDNSDEVLSPEVVAERAQKFLDAIALAKDSYDNVIHAQTQKYEAIYSKNEDPVKRALAFAKIMLARVGLKLRSKKVRVGEETQYHYHIANIEAAREFISWREPELSSSKIEFTDSPMDGIISGRKEAYALYGKLNPDEQKKVMALMDDLNDFNSVVDVMRLGGELQW